MSGPPRGGQPAGHHGEGAVAGAQQLLHLDVTEWRPLRVEGGAERSHRGRTRTIPAAEQVQQHERPV